MADECGGPSTTSGCIYNSLALRIVRRGGRLRKALVGRERKGEKGDGAELREGAIVGSCIQYSMHRRAACVVAGARRPVRSNSRPSSANVARDTVRDVAPGIIHWDKSIKRVR